MAAVGSEVTGSLFLSPGVVSFFLLLLLLSIFVAALCTDCRRHSFELRDADVDRNPSSLIRVVKLEETMGARENPMIGEMQNDEKVNPVAFTPWRSHLGAPHNHQDVQTNGSAAVMKTASDSGTSGDENVSVTPWRSHLGAPQSQDLSGSTRPDHIYSVIGGGRSSGGEADLPPPPTNREPEEERSPRSEDFIDRNSMYARVSKKERQATPTVHTPEEVQVEEEEEEEESPPLPDRRTQLDG